MSESTTFKLPYYAPIEPRKIEGLNLRVPFIDNYIPVSMGGPFETHAEPDINLLLDQEAIAMSFGNKPFGFMSYAPGGAIIRTQKASEMILSPNRPGWWDITMETGAELTKEDLDIAGRGLNIFITYAVQKYRNA